MDEIQILRKKLEREKKAREVLENMIETRTRGLYLAGKKLEKERDNLKERTKELDGLYNLGKLTEQIDDLEELDSGVMIVHFYPVQFTGDEAKVIELAKENDFLTIEIVCTAFNWSQDRALKILKSLEDSGLAKFRESLLTGKQWFFPSI